VTSKTIVLAAVCALTCASNTAACADQAYAWPSAPKAASSLADRISPPEGFQRLRAPLGSWGEWLRGLPLKASGAPVLTYTGAQKWRQDVHAAVIDIDTGTRDLQQCADAVMRLRAEWLFAADRKSEIAFNDTDGKRRRFSADAKQDYSAFRKYMNLVFAYAGTWSLDRELKPVALKDIAIGDVFIKGGFPGHAVLVADVVKNSATGDLRFLLIQSYMPAQDMHVLKNPESSDGNPWYALPTAAKLVTPEWTFDVTQLKRWP
jgi:Domain of unknown function (4846)